jgi:hypothetical protein
VKWLFEGMGQEAASMLLYRIASLVFAKAASS